MSVPAHHTRDSHATPLKRNNRNVHVTFGSSRTNVIPEEREQDNLETKASLRKTFFAIRVKQGSWRQQKDEDQGWSLLSAKHPLAINKALFAIRNKALGNIKNKNTRITGLFPSIRNRKHHFGINFNLCGCHICP
eukprot:TRINITY_DN61567_c0_g1_i1.p1 TRINITY_DN61567_c0_g1~~TRINITY_DN61567_c0_g1_i1.p1  ORF type:complete len:135 (+),score=2.25 TRINITY_DN61567_c0_g1_i1:28-432(+)